MIDSPHPPTLKIVIGVIVGLAGWGLLLLNPKSKRQWVLASLLFAVVLLYLIFGR